MIFSCRTVRSGRALAQIDAKMEHITKKRNKKPTDDEMEKKGKWNSYMQTNRNVERCIAHKHKKKEYNPKVCVIAVDNSNKIKP